MRTLRSVVRSRTFATALAVCGSVFLGACDDSTSLTAPLEERSDAVVGSDSLLTRSLALSTATPLSMGWLAPLGAASSSAPMDPSLRPVVTICRWIKDMCVGVPLAQFSVDNGLVVGTSGFEAAWDLSAPHIPSARLTYRIVVTLGANAVGLPILVDVVRGKWALVVPGQTPTLTAESRLLLRFRLGERTTEPPPIETVASGLQSASTQFFPSTAGETTRTSEQTASLTTLSTSLASFQTALAGPPEAALLALSQATSAADFAFLIAPAGDKADLDVIRLELAQAGKLFGVSN